jgi:hypothetical protein
MDGRCSFPGVLQSIKVNALGESITVLRDIGTSFLGSQSYKSSLQRGAREYVFDFGSWDIALKAGCVPSLNLMMGLEKAEWFQGLGFCF